MTKTVLGIFDNRQNTEDAISELEEAGYRAKDISIMMKDTEQADVIAQDTGTDVIGGAAGGATTGAVLGGIAGLLIGVGAIAIPGIGGLLIGGPLAAALGLSGAAATTATGAVTGAVAGGLIGALMSLGLSRDDAQVYENRIKEGAILLAVPSQTGRTSEVRGILEDNGATDIRTVASEDRFVDRRYTDDYAAGDYTDEGYAPIAAKGGSTTRRKRRIIEE